MTLRDIAGLAASARDPDGQPVGVPHERHAHRGLARDVGERGVRDERVDLPGDAEHQRGNAQERREPRGRDDLVDACLARRRLERAELRRREAERGREQDVEALEGVRDGARHRLEPAARAFERGAVDGAAEHADDPRSGLEVAASQRPAAEPRAVGEVRGGGDGDHDREVDGEALGIDGQMEHVHRVSERGAEGRGVVSRGEDVGMRRPREERCLAEGDAKAAGILADLREEGTRRGRSGVRSASFDAVRGVEQRGAVTDAARERVIEGVPEPALGVIGADGGAAARGLHAEDAAARGGDADGAAAVSAVSHGRDARRDDRTGAAARATGVVRQRPGVLRRLEGLGLGVRREAELGRVGLAGKDEPSLPVAAYELAVVVGDVVHPEARAAREADARDGLHEVFHEEGHAGEGALERALCGGAGLVVHARDDGVELPVDAVDARDALVDELEGRHLLRADQLRQPQRVSRSVVGDLPHAASPITPA